MFPFGAVYSLYIRLSYQGLTYPRASCPDVALQLEAPRLPIHCHSAEATTCSIFRISITKYSTATATNRPPVHLESHRSVHSYTGSRTRTNQLEFCREFSNASSML